MRKLTLPIRIYELNLYLNFKLIYFLSQAESSNKTLQSVRLRKVSNHQQKLSSGFVCRPNLFAVVDVAMHFESANGFDARRKLKDAGRWRLFGGAI